MIWLTKAFGLLKWVGSKLNLTAYVAIAGLLLSSYTYLQGVKAGKLKGQEIAQKACLKVTDKLQERIQQLTDELAKYKENVIKYEQDKKQEYIENMEAVNKALNDSLRKTERLEKRIGDLRREQETVTFKPRTGCDLNADELRKLQAAYGLRARVSADVLPNG